MASNRLKPGGMRIQLLPKTVRLTPALSCWANNASMSIVLRGVLSRYHDGGMRCEWQSTVSGLPSKPGISQAMNCLPLVGAGSLLCLFERPPRPDHGHLSLVVRRAAEVGDRVDQILHLLRGLAQPLRRQVLALQGRLGRFGAQGGGSGGAKGHPRLAAAIRAVLQR